MNEVQTLCKTLKLEDFFNVNELTKTYSDAVIAQVLHCLLTTQMVNNPKGLATVTRAVIVRVLEMQDSDLPIETGYLDWLTQILELGLFPKNKFTLTTFLALVSQLSSWDYTRIWLEHVLRMDIFEGVHIAQIVRIIGHQDFVLENTHYKKEILRLFLHQIQQIQIRSTEISSYGWVEEAYKLFKDIRTPDFDRVFHNAFILQLTHDHDGIRNTNNYVKLIKLLTFAHKEPLTDSELAEIAQTQDRYISKLADHLESLAPMSTFSTVSESWKDYFFSPVLEYQGVSCTRIVRSIQEKKIQTLQKFFEAKQLAFMSWHTSKIPRDTTVFRGGSWDPSNPDDRKVIAQIKSGLLEFPSFMSTSISPAIAAKFSEANRQTHRQVGPIRYLYVIRLPKDFAVFHIPPFRTTETEKELLLPPCCRFRSKVWIGDFQTRRYECDDPMRAITMTDEQFYRHIPNSMCPVTVVELEAISYGQLFYTSPYRRFNELEFFQDALKRIHLDVVFEKIEADYKDMLKLLQGDYESMLQAMECKYFRSFE